MIMNQGDISDHQDLHFSKLVFRNKFDFPTKEHFDLPLYITYTTLQLSRRQR